MITIKELKEEAELSKKFGKRAESIKEVKEALKELKPHKKQLLFIKAKQFMRIWLSARRTGKTTCIILDNLETIKFVAPELRGYILKIYPTQEKGIDLIYDEVCATLDNLKYLRNEQRSYGRIETINNCIIKFLGLRNDRDAEKIRGFKNKSIDFDECQSMVSEVLKYAIASPAIQSLSDFMPFGSHLNMYGTPPPSIGHIFAKKFLEENPEIFKITALMEDNPHYPEESRNRVKRELKNFLSIPLNLPDDKITHPFYRREILGDCINDPYKIIFNKDYYEGHLYETLPPAKDDDKYFMSIYVSKKADLAISVNRTNPNNSRVYAIHEEDNQKYQSIQQIPFKIKEIKEKYSIDQSNLTVLLSYPKISEELTSMIATYYNTPITISEDFESELFPLFAEKININFLLKNFKVKKDSAFLKGCDEVFWNDMRDNIDESVQSPIVYSQLLAWAEIANLAVSETNPELITDPAEIFRARLEARQIK